MKLSRRISLFWWIKMKEKMDSDIWLYGILLWLFHSMKNNWVQFYNNPQICFFTCGFAKCTSHIFWFVLLLQFMYFQLSGCMNRLTDSFSRTYTEDSVPDSCNDVIAQNVHYFSEHLLMFRLGHRSIIVRKVKSIFHPICIQLVFHQVKHNYSLFMNSIYEVTLLI